MGGHNIMHETRLAITLRTLAVGAQKRGALARQPVDGGGSHLGLAVAAADVRAQIVHACHDGAARAANSPPIRLQYMLEQMLSFL